MVHRILISCMLTLLLYGMGAGQGKYDWSQSTYKIRPGNNPHAKELPLIRVNGNSFVNPSGDTLIFRGAAIADPDRIDQEGHWNKAIFEKLKEFGVTVVRIPIHPAAWRARTAAKYIPLLDDAVAWCTELGLYIDIDWHSIGNLTMEIFQDPMYNTTRQETYEFWRTMAIRYQGNHTVVFFELFNEPTIADGKMGSASWSEWKKINENMIHIIRAYDKEKIPLVAGFDWAYDLTPLHLEPIDAEGIGYTTHPYQEKRHRPFEAKWEEDFGFAANWYPVVATEFGFSTEWRNAEESRAYAKEIIAYLEAKHISWIVWVYDPEWGPRLIESWSTFKPTESGEFFSGAMHVNVR